MPVRRQHGSRLPVKNRRLVDTALNTMRNLHTANMENVDNAIQGTGFPVTIYNRLAIGNRCTCSFQSQRLLDDAGNLPEHQIDSILGHENGLVDYAEDRKHKRPLGHNTEIVMAEKVNNQAGQFDPDSGLSQSWVGEGDLTDDEDEANEQGIGDPHLKVMRSDSRACGICFGTTIVGGYSLIDGQRIVLSSVEMEESHLAEIEVTGSPNFFTLHINGWVRWFVTVSGASQFALQPRLFNNVTPIRHEDYVIEWRDGNVWRELEDPLAIATGEETELRVRNMHEDVLKFTHIELVYSFRALNDPKKADFPAIQKMTSQTMADALSGTTIIVAGEVLLNKMAVVIDHLPYLSRHWMVSQVNPRRDNFGRVYDVSLEGRAQDVNELGQLLRPVTDQKEPLI